MNLYEATLQLARSIKDAKFKASALGNVVAALEKSGDQEHSEALFNEMLGGAYTFENKQDADSAFGLIAIGLIKAANFEKAWQIINLISDPPSKDATLCDIALTLADNGDCTTALTFAEAIQDDTPSKALALQQTAYALAESKRFDEALNVTKKIDDLRRKTMTFMKIVATLAETGNVDQALEIAHTLPESEDKAYLLIDIAAVLAENGDVNKALEVAETIPNEPFKSYALLDISTNILSLNLPEAQQTELTTRIMQTLSQ